MYLPNNSLKNLDSVILIILPLFIAGTPKIFSYKSSLKARITTSVLAFFNALMYFATTNKKNLSLKIFKPLSADLDKSKVINDLRINKTASIGCWLP